MGQWPCLFKCKINLMIMFICFFRTLEVVIRFSYLSKKVPELEKCDKATELYKICSDRNFKESIRFAQFRFFRTYGENRRDSQWMIKDIYYYTSRDKISFRGYVLRKYQNFMRRRSFWTWHWVIPRLDGIVLTEFTDRWIHV